MKVLLVLCVLTIIATVYGAPNGDCYYDERGLCYEQCEEGTHSYTTGCGYLTPEPTCQNPKPVEDTRGQICDYSACYCNSPTVRDSVSGKCVKLEDCPPKNEKKDDKGQKE